MNHAPSGSATDFFNSLLGVLTAFGLLALTRVEAAQSMPDMPGMDMGAPMMASQMGAYPMTRDASGTAWQPDSTPMQGFAWTAGGWLGMSSGYADLVYDAQTGPRGADKTFSESMLMTMAQHEALGGDLTLRSMLSLDPLMGPSGYPLLLQTGETANGVTPLVDRQHPHNLFMEMGAVYDHPLSDGVSGFLYVADPGEPALGPVTFMSRVSGMDDPAAPITHHWLDSTHISFGVVTAGLASGPFKLEASLFNGREPDQDRWGYQPLRLDSWSTRLSLNPTPDLAFQVSYGQLHSPEQLEPLVDQDRMTASATYNRPLHGGNWQTTLAWGRDMDRPGLATNGWLAESDLTIGRHTLFGRAETVTKDDLTPPPPALAAQASQVSEISLGYLYDLPIARHIALGLGLEVTRDLVPEPRAAAYGPAPAGFMPFVRLKVR